MKASFCCTLLALVVLTFAASWPVSAQGDDWGTIKGRITWGGDKLPKQAAIDLGNNPAKADCLKANKGQPPFDEEWVVNPKNKGIRDTFVWLADFENPRKKEPLPTHPSLKEPNPKKVVLNQPACCFMPHAIGLREGQILHVTNNATFPHNFKYTGNPISKNAGENFLLPPGTFRDVTLEADRLPIKMECNIHPWMNGWIRVFSHPYFAVTDADGNFEFKNAPAGKYRLMIWHGSAGYLGGAKGKDGRPIDIKAGAVTDLGAIDFPPPAN